MTPVFKPITFSQWLFCTVYVVKPTIVGTCLADASILFHNFVSCIFKASNARVNGDVCNNNINVKSFCLFVFFIHVTRCMWSIFSMFNMSCLCEGRILWSTTRTRWKVSTLWVHSQLFSSGIRHTSKPLVFLENQSLWRKTSQIKKDVLAVKVDYPHELGLTLVYKPRPHWCKMTASPLYHHFYLS